MSQQDADKLTRRSRPRSSGDGELLIPGMDPTAWSTSGFHFQDRPKCDLRRKSRCDRAQDEGRRCSNGQREVAPVTQTLHRPWRRRWLDRSSRSTRWTCLLSPVVSGVLRSGRALAAPAPVARELRHPRSPRRRGPSAKRRLSVGRVAPMDVTPHSWDARCALRTSLPQGSRSTTVTPGRISSEPSTAANSSGAVLHRSSGQVCGKARELHCKAFGGARRDAMPVKAATERCGHELDALAKGGRLVGLFQVAAAFAPQAALPGSKGQP